MKGRKRRNNRSWEKLFQRIIAVTMALFMVISVMPALRPSAAANTKIRFSMISANKGIEVQGEKYYLAENVINNDYVLKNDNIAGSGYNDAAKPGKFLFYLSQVPSTNGNRGVMNKSVKDYKVCFSEDEIAATRKDVVQDLLTNGEAKKNNTHWHFSFYTRYSIINYRTYSGALIDSDKRISPTLVWAKTSDIPSYSSQIAAVRLRYKLDYSNFVSKGGHATKFSVEVPQAPTFSAYDENKVIDHDRKEAYYEFTVKVWANDSDNYDYRPEGARFPLTRHPGTGSDNDRKIRISTDWVPASLSYKLTYNSKFPNGTNRTTNDMYLNDNLSNATLKTPAVLGYTYDHYQFTGWKDTGENKIYQPGNSVLMLGNRNLEAQWKQVDFQVKYDKNGATVGNAPATSNYYPVNTQVTVSDGSDLKKPGKLFDCWNTKADGTGTNYGANSKIPMVNGGVTLYAKWKDAPKFVLSYDGNGGSGSMASENYYDDGIASSKSVSVKNSAFTKAGLHFKKWQSDDAAGTYYVPQSSFVINRDTELKALWGAKLLYNANASDAVGSVPVDNNVYEEGEETTVKNNAGPDPLKRPKHQFSGWDDDPDSEEENCDYDPGRQDKLQLTTDKTVYAHWKASPEYNVKYMLNAPDDVSGEEIGSAQAAVPKDNTTYYDDGIKDEIRIPGAPSNMSFTGYRFDGWAEAEDGNVKYRGGDIYTINSRSPKETVLYAKWVPAKKYHISYDLNLPAGSSADDVTGTVPTDSNEYYNDRIHDKMPIADPESTGLGIKNQTFLEWNTKADGTGDSYKPGDPSIPVTKYSKDVKLYAQWLTHLYITGLDKTDKIYDGTAAWSGNIQFTGARTGERIKITSTTPVYTDTEGTADKNAGIGKPLSLPGLKVIGDGAAHYMIKGAAGDTGTYSEDDNTYITRGTIKKRDITITPTADPSVITKGNTIPGNIFGLSVTDGTLGSGDSLESDFGTPEYSCIFTKDDGTEIPLAQDSEANGPRDYYKLSVNGLTNDNYQITLDTSKVKVVLPASVQAKVTYDANGGTGAVPVDSDSPYYISADPSAATMINVLQNVNVTRSGYQFLGWDRNQNCRNIPEFPDNGQPQSFQLTGDTTLYAVWKGSTPLTINGLDTRSKVYDGTTDYTGTVDVTPAVPTDDVSIRFTKGEFDTKNVGTDKTITLEGITLTGADADKYVLVNGGMYDAAANTITVHSGEITKRDITVKPVLSDSQQLNNQPLQSFGTALAGGTTLGAGDKLEDDFGTPVFHCSNAAGEDFEIGCEPDHYKVTVSGLNNENYNISYEDTGLNVVDPSGKRKVALSYDGNGADGGQVPQAQDYYIFTNTDDNEWADIAADLPEKRGCRFAGWSTNQNAVPGGSDPIYQPGDISAFQMQANTTLYAVWQADTPLQVTGLTDKSMVYNNTDVWSGDIEVQGIADGDDVKLAYTDGKYDQKNEGENIPIHVKGLTLSGADATRYYLTDGGRGIYNSTTNELTVPDGEITKRPITIQTDVPEGVQKAQRDNPVPHFGYSKADTGETFAQGETIDVIDDTNVAYTIKDKNGDVWSWDDIETAGTYFVEVRGLAADNYNIKYEKGRLAVEDKYGTYPVYITYHANGADGNVPVDDPDEDYLLYQDPDIEKPTTVVLSPDDLEKKGYKFKEWNTMANGTGTAYQPGDQIVLNGDVDLHAVYVGDTPLYITGLTNLKKIYDGSQTWQGNVLIDGDDPADHIQVTYTDGLYSDKDAGNGKLVKAMGVTIHGDNLDKYIIQDTETATYDELDQIVTVNYGEIDPRGLEIIPIGTPGALDWSTGAPTYRMNYGDEAPGYQLFLPAQAQIINPDLIRDFGAPAYDCRNTSGETLAKNSSPGYYRLTVDGLSHRNYDIQPGSSYVEVYAPGMREAHVTYYANGGLGMVPVDRNRYSIFDDTSLNSMVSVQNHTLTKDGYRFTGWNTQADGNGTAYQPGAQFRITEDTDLYAVWEKVIGFDPDPNEPDKPINPDKNQDPASPENPDHVQDNKPEAGNDITDKINVAKTVDTNTKPQAAKEKDIKKQSKNDKNSKDGVFKLKSVDSARNQLTSLYDEEVPKGAAPYGAQQKQQSWFDRMLGSGLGPISECIIHWLFILLTLGTALYDVLRHRHIKKKERTEASLLYDQLLPLAAEPLGLILFMFRRCALDLWFALACFLITALGSYFLNRYYSDQEMDEMYQDESI